MYYLIVLLRSEHSTFVDTLSVVANKELKKKVVELLKKHVESINIFYI